MARAQSTATLEVLSPVPEIVTFSGLTSNLELPAPEGRTLSWSTRFATHVEIWEVSGTPQTLVSAPNAPSSGSMVWRPTVPGTYLLELRAIGPDGLVSDPAANPAQSESRCVRPLTAMDFQASSTGVVSGAPFSLTWTTSGSTQPLLLEESTVNDTTGFVPLEPFGAGMPLPESTTTPVVLTRSLPGEATRADHYFRLTGVNSRGSTSKVIKVTLGQTPPQPFSATAVPNPVQRNNDLRSPG